MPTLCDRSGGCGGKVVCIFDEMEVCVIESEMGVVSVVCVPVCVRVLLCVIVCACLVRNWCALASVLAVCACCMCLLCVLALCA